MRRNTLYRGQRIDDRKWVYGYYYANEEIISQKVHYYITAEDDFPTEVIPETVGQYTGMQDKNGNKIFEGDIIQYTHIDKKTELSKVIYKPSEFCLKFKSMKMAQRGLLDEFGRKYVEVVGNVYDNPELLEEV